MGNTKKEASLKDITANKENRRYNSKISKSNTNRDNSTGISNRIDFKENQLYGSLKF